MKPLFCYILCLLLLTACRKNDTVPAPIIRDSLGQVNQWILDSMQRFYYWQDELPAGPDFSLTSENFFASLLSGHDRFSHISGYGIPPASNSYFVFGFHYVLSEVPGYNGYIGVVTFVNTNGAAYRAGFRRGSYFTAVNGQSISPQNSTAVNKLLNESGTLSITPAIYNSGSFTPGDPVLLTPFYATEHAVHYTRVFQQNGKKTGYLYYSSFDENYDADLLTAFNKFRTAGITGLIIDLRYNAGGSVASSAKLAALISDRLTQQEVFAIYQGNKYEGRRSQTLQAALQTSNAAPGRQYADLAKAGVHLDKVYILTTGITMSASELLINNLPPFLEVIQIGEKTFGKDEATFIIKDLRNPKKVSWTLQPVIYKLLNKLGRGDYAAGIAPKYIVDETATLPLGDIGTSQDRLIHKALELIYGTSVPADPVDLRRAHPPVPARVIYRSGANVALPVNITKL